MSGNITVSQVDIMIDKAERELEKALAAVSDASGMVIDHVETTYGIDKGKFNYNVKIIAVLPRGKN